MRPLAINFRTWFFSLENNKVKMILLREYPSLVFLLQSNPLIKMLIKILEASHHLTLAYASFLHSVQDLNLPHLTYYKAG
jgi:hypothetical protein